MLVLQIIFLNSLWGLRLLVKKVYYKLRNAMAEIFNSLPDVKKAWLCQFEMIYIIVSIVNFNAIAVE